jgi:ribose/xylose/arabinose/galactoside ABC-type transport system permease subunit
MSTQEQTDGDTAQPRRDDDLSVEGEGPSGFAKRRRRLPGAQHFGLIGALFGVGLVVSRLTPFFLGTQNLLNVLTAVSFTGIVAAITTAVLIGGGLDLSIAAVMAFSGTIVAVALDNGANAAVAIALALGASALVGFANGGLISYGGINPFVITVGMQFLVRGFAFRVTGGRVVRVVSSDVRYLGQGDLLGIPVPVWFMVVIFGIVGWLLHTTVWGRHWYAIGGTPGGAMARLAGIPVKRRRLQLYVLSSLAAGLSGVLVAGFTTVGDANGLAGLELSILAGVILGGTALMGGRGTVFGTLLGVLLIGIIDNAIQLLNYGISAQFLFLGTALLLAVIYDHFRTEGWGNS